MDRSPGPHQTGGPRHPAAARLHVDAVAHRLVLQVGHHVGRLNVRQPNAVAAAYDAQRQPRGGASARHGRCGSVSVAVAVREVGLYGALILFQRPRYVAQVS